MPQFNYSINWNKVIRENIPMFLHQTFRLSMCLAMIKPFKMIYSEFLSTRQEYRYKVGFNGQINYLQTILNERFDPNGNGIYISDGNTNSAHYLYYRIEGKPPRYMYWRWSNSQIYSPGDFAVDGSIVYKALLPNSHKMPSLYPLHWEYYKEVEYRYFRSEYAIQYEFIVNVPSTITFNNKAMRALIDFYRLAGKRYKIVLY